MNHTIQNSDFDRAFVSGEEFTGSIFKNAGVAMFITRGEKIEFSNAALENLTGYSDKELVGISCLDLIHPDDHPVFADLRKVRSKRKKISSRYELRILTKQGAHRWVERHQSFISLQDRSVVLHIILDIHERKIAAEILKTNDVVLQSIFDACPVGLALLQNRIVKKVNKAFCTILGYSETELVNKSIRMVYPDEESFVEIGRKLYDNAVGVEVRNVESVYKCKDGTVIDVLLNTAAFDAHNPFAGICATVVDITNEKRIRKSLEASESRFRDMCDFLPQIIFEIDRDGTITYANQQAFSALGYSRRDVENGFNILNTLVEGERDKAVSNIKKVLSGASHKRTRYTALRKDRSTFPVMAFSSPIKNNEIIRGMRGLLIDLSEMDKAQQKLNSTLQQMHDIIEFQPDPTFVIDSAGKVVAWNRAIEELTGVKKKDMVGEGDYAYAVPFYNERRPILVDLVFAVDAEVVSKYSYVTSSGNKLTAEVWIPHLDNGKGVYLWGNASPLYDHTGKRIGAIETIRDITAMKRTEMMLRKSEERFRNLFETSIEGIYRTTIDGKNLDVNQAFVRMLGYETPEELIESIAGGTDRLFVVNEHAREIITRLTSEGSVRGFETQLYKKNNEVIWVLINAGVVKDQQGRPEYYSGGMMDITERKLAESAIRESEERFRQIAENVDDGFWVGDFISHKILYTNPALNKIYGISLTGKLLEDMLDFVHPEDRSRVMYMRSSGKCAEIEYRLVRPDGDIRWLRSRVFLIPDAQGNIFRIIGITTDVTLYKKAAQEAELHRIQMIQSEKMATLGVIVSGVAHEINNPNNYLMLNSKIIERAWKDLLPIIEKHYLENPGFKIADLEYAEARDLLPDIIRGLNDGTQRIKRIVDSLRDYARKDATETDRSIDVNKVVESSIVLLSNMIKKATDVFSTKLGEGLPAVKGNGQQIEQVVINLLANACEALTQRSQAIVLSTSSGDGFVEICVIDEGRGIAPEHNKNIFDPFFTTKRESGGTGLGLPISLNFIKNMGGNIDFASEYGKGTTVTVRLPATGTSKNG